MGSIELGFARGDDEALAPTMGKVLLIVFMFFCTAVRAGPPSSPGGPRVYESDEYGTFYWEYIFSTHPTEGSGWKKSYELPSKPNLDIPTPLDNTQALPEKSISDPLNVDLETIPGQGREGNGDPGVSLGPLGDGYRTEGLGPLFEPAVNSIIRGEDRAFESYTMVREAPVVIKRKQFRIEASQLSARQAVFDRYKINQMGFSVFELRNSNDLVDFFSIPNPPDDVLPYRFESPEGEFRDNLLRLYKDLYKVSPISGRMKIARELALVAVEGADSSYDPGGVEATTWLQVAYGMKATMGKINSENESLARLGYDCYRIVVGRDFVTGEKEGIMDRAVALAGAGAYFENLYKTGNIGTTVRVISQLAEKSVNRANLGGLNLVQDAIKQGEHILIIEKNLSIGRKDSGGFGKGIEMFELADVRDGCLGGPGGGGTRDNRGVCEEAGRKTVNVLDEVLARGGTQIFAENPPGDMLEEGPRLQGPWWQMPVGNSIRQFGTNPAIEDLVMKWAQSEMKASPKVRMEFHRKLERIGSIAEQYKVEKGDLSISWAEQQARREKYIDKIGERYDGVFGLGVNWLGWEKDLFIKAGRVYARRLLDDIDFVDRMQFQKEHAEMVYKVVSESPGSGWHGKSKEEIYRLLYPER